MGRKKSVLQKAKKVLCQSDVPEFLSMDTATGPIIELINTTIHKRIVQTSNAGKKSAEVRRTQQGRKKPKITFDEFVADYKKYRAIKNDREIIGILKKKYDCTDRYLRIKRKQAKLKGLL